MSQFIFASHHYLTRKVSVIYFMSDPIHNLRSYISFLAQFKIQVDYTQMEYRFNKLYNPSILHCYISVLTQFKI